MRHTYGHPPHACASEPNLGRVDLSALIFVALAVAWAVYLIPKALKHHDEVVRSRSVDRFSHTMRVLARREPVSRRNARLVVTPGRAASAPTVDDQGVEPSLADPAPSSARTPRPPPRGAARRRRRVLGLLLLANAVVIGARRRPTSSPGRGSPSRPACSSPGWSPAG